MAELIRRIEREYYNAHGLQELTGISADTWLYYAWSGKGPASLKVGRHRLWRKDVVDAWLRGQETADA